MNAHFKLKDFQLGEGVARGAFGERFEMHDWIDVPVPGDVHQALFKAGCIPDPFYDQNELQCAWIEEREWWYRAEFHLERAPRPPEERLRLIFHGLDNFTTIWLNGEKLGRHENMFRPAEFDITDLVHRQGVNTLALCFDPPLSQVKDKTPLLWRWDDLEETKRNLMRKAQFGFGWDWGPRLPTIGIWRPVELSYQTQAAIQGVKFATLEIEPGGKRALLYVQVEVVRFAGHKPLKTVIALTPPRSDAAVVEFEVDLEGQGGSLSAEKTLTISEPELWWTHDLGNPSLYTLSVRILQGDLELDWVEQQVGIRTIELDQSPDPQEPGTRFFRFILNSVPIFARGANWVPASSFVGAITPQRYEQLLSAAREANMNMLRVWGGGIYEHDAFYNICDRLGMLVWQDFMFACAPYPEDDPQFVSEVQAEVRYQVRRLRNHPSLALWCGNNENQMLYHRIAADQGLQDTVPGTLYYDHVIPDILQELDGFTPYWPGSPYGGPHPNSMLEGDVHDWHVWHGFPVDGLPAGELEKHLSSEPGPEQVYFVHYAEDMGRFISEFGMHASPVYETLRRGIPSDQLYHHSPSMDHHNKDNPKNKGDNLMLSVTGLPGDLDEYIDFSMIAQAEGLKFGIEHFRRRKPHCSGVLIWQFNDCWPVLSWSILDYYGFGKAAYYYVKRAYAPVLASFKPLPEGGVELWITNETLEDVQDRITVQLGSFAEGKLWEEERRIRAPANSSQVVWRGETELVDAQPDRYLAVRSHSGRFLSNRHFFAPIKDLQRPIGEPDVSFSPQGEHALSAQVNASDYVFYFHLTSPDEHTRFSDNYFDLIPGESRTIQVTNQASPLTLDMLSVGWR
jgi:beta-mannosidase